MRLISPMTTRPTITYPSFTMSDVFEDLDRMVDSFARPVRVNTVGFLPACDIHETKEHYLATFDVPGVKREDIKIEVKGTVLSVSGERQREFKEYDSQSGLRHERSYGKFERTFDLPRSINADKIEAHFENGVLTIAIPKIEAEKSRAVQIQTGQPGFFEKLLGAKREAVKDINEVKLS